MGKPKRITVTPIKQIHRYGKPLKGVRGAGTPHKASPRPEQVVMLTPGSYEKPPYGGGDLPKMPKPKTPRGAGTAKVVKAAGKAVHKAATAASPGTMAGKAAGWVKRQGFVPTIR